jgi:hypothetical protein
MGLTRSEFLQDPSMHARERCFHVRFSRRDYSASLPLRSAAHNRLQHLLSAGRQKVASVP